MLATFSTGENDLEESALDGVEPAAGGLTEICRQQYQGAGDEQSEDCTAPANHFAVVHEKGSRHAKSAAHDQ